MDIENFGVIEDLYSDIKKEQEEQLESLKKKKCQIAEIDTYLDGILSKEQNDLQVFLPRKVENLYHDVIEQNKQKREKLVAECDEIEKFLHMGEVKLERLERIIANQSVLFHLKQLSVLDVQEKERQRIARDLHDSSLQNLTHLVHKVELSSLYIDQDPVKAKLELATVESGLRKVIDDIRNRIYDLRPMTFDDLGLKEALLKLFVVLNQDEKYKIETDIDDINADLSDSETELALINIYRIIQECVQNSISHSKGDWISVSLKDEKKFYKISIQDNGVGFDLKEAIKKNRHFGLLVVEERVFLLNGNIQINAENGTSILIEIPKKVEEE
ncbi:sensor histidine kinase [bacterium 0.1xD8-71]|nr:sensor histidine kinase [bacterium 0.1xD8-71]